MSTRTPEKFEDRLLGELLAFQATQAHDGAARREPVRTGTVRRRSTPALIGVAAIVVAVALVTASIVRQSAHRAEPERRATKPPTSAPAPSVSLRARMIAAVTRAQDLVMHSNVVTPAGEQLDLWKDPVSRAMTSTMRDAHGAVVTEIASRPTTDGGFESMIVDGRNKTWFHRVLAPQSAAAKFLKGFSWANQPYDAETLKRNLAEIASFTIVGTEVVDGVDATHVHVVAKDDGALDLWIDPTTALPLKSVSTGTESTVATSRRSAHYAWYAQGAVTLPWPTPPEGYTEKEPATPNLAP